MEAMKKCPVFFLVSVAVQRGFAVSEIAIPVAEKPFVVISYFTAHVFSRHL
jgi:hypothetical protein